MNIDYSLENKSAKKTKTVLAWRAPREVIADFSKRKTLLGMKEDSEFLAEIYRDGLEPAFARLLKVKAEEAQHTLLALQEHSAEIKRTARQTLARARNSKQARSA